MTHHAEPIAGFAVMDFGEQKAHLSLLAVAPRKRRLGIAKHLLGWLEKTSTVAGIAEITLEVRAQNVGARRFYRRLGYEECEQIPRYYSGRENAYRLRKTLRDRFDD
jgi:ribosomal-protein-alanine N-acetyltransferase